MSVCDFDRLFDMTQEPPIFLASRGGNQQIEQWISSDEDKLFLKFIHYIEIRFLEKHRETYIQVVDNIIRIQDDPNIIIDVTSPIYYEIRRLKWKLCLYDNRYSGREKDNVIRDWLKTCLNLSDNKDTEFYLEVSEHDREKEVCEILFQEGKLREFFTQDVGLSYLHLILDWFLKRYDLITAFRIISQIEKDNFLFWLLKRVYRTRLVLMMILLISFLVIAILLLTKLSTNFVISENNFLNNFPIFKNPNTEFFDKDAVVYNNLISPILAIIYLALLFFIPYFTIRSVIWLKLIVPRLVAAIILGFFVPWATDEIWRYSISITPLAAIIIFLFSNLIAYLYLKIEINNAKVAPSNIKTRAFTIWLLGIVESLTIALVVSDFASQYFIPIENHRPLCGVFGIIYPQVVFIYSALALLIGIFVQIIWEEKPITHPL